VDGEVAVAVASVHAEVLLVTDEPVVVEMRALAPSYQRMSTRQSLVVVAARNWAVAV
jgi:hypothetical protein